MVVGVYASLGTGSPTQWGEGDHDQMVHQRSVGDCASRENASDRVVASTRVSGTPVKPRPGLDVEPEAGAPPQDLPPSTTVQKCSLHCLPGITR